jgi:hypothetical protein
MERPLADMGILAMTVGGGKISPDEKDAISGAFGS